MPLTVPAADAAELDSFYGGLSPDANRDWRARYEGVIPPGLDVSTAWPKVSAWLRRPVVQGKPPAAVVASARALPDAQRQATELAMSWSALAKLTAEAAALAVGTEHEQYSAQWAQAAKLRRDYYLGVAELPPAPVEAEADTPVLG